MIRLVLAIAAVASSVSGHYRLLGDRAEPGAHSCGAAERLASDHYDVVVGADGASVNGTPWKIESRGDRGVKLSHGNPGSFMMMTLFVDADGVVGYVSLRGIDANRAECSDRATLR